MKITSTLKNIFPAVRRPSPQPRRGPTNGFIESVASGHKTIGTPPPPEATPECHNINHAMPITASARPHRSPSIAPVRRPSTPPRRGPTNGIMHPTKTMLMLLFAAALGFTSLPAQWTPDSLCSSYDLASKQIQALRFDACIALTTIIAEEALQAGDTNMACNALFLEALAYADNAQQGLSILQRATQLHEKAFGATSILYYKMLTLQSRRYKDIAQFKQAFIILTRLRNMEPQLLKLHPQLGFQLVFDARMQTVYLFEELGDVASSIDAAEEDIAFADEHLGLITERLRADGYSRLSQNYRNAKNLPEAEARNRRAAQILDSIPDPTSQIVLSRLQYDGDYALILSDAGRWEEALQLLQACRDSLSRNFPDYATKFAANDANAGYVFTRMGRLKEAQDRTTAARAIFAAAGEGAYSYTSKMDINLAGISGKQARFADQVRYAQIAIDSLDRNQINSGKDFSTAWKEAALGYIGLGRADSASKCIEQAMRAAARHQQSSFKAAGDWQNTAEGYVAMSETTDHAASSDIAQVGLPNFDNSCATWWLAQGDHCKEIEYLDSAIHCLRRSLKAACLHVTGPDVLAQEFEAIKVQPGFLESLQLMGQVHERLYLRTGCLPFLHTATAYYNRAAQLIAYIDASRLNFGASYFKWENLWKDNYDVLESAIRCGVQLHARTHDMQYLHAAHAIADRSKARLLSKSQLFLGDAFSNMIPNSIQEAEKTCLQTLGLLRKSNQDEGTLQETAQWESKWLRLKQGMRKYYPRYYQLKYQDQANFALTEAALQAPLGEGNATLDYFVGRDSIYAFLRTADTLQVAIISKGRDIAQTASEFVAAIQHKDCEGQVVALGSYLGRKLLPFPKPTQPIGHLLIIPDGFLHGLPFAALLRPDCAYDPFGANTEPPYLQKYLAIAQDFSTVSHYVTLRNLATHAPIEVIHGLFPRPQYSYCDSLADTLNVLLPPLESDELEAFANTGLVQKIENSTLEALFAALQQHGILEIKTHGFTRTTKEGPDAYILLQDAQGRAVEFHMHELYGLPSFETRLLILNACATAAGPYQAGEGPISLARSFRQAGCPSLLTNLWNADDQANTLLLKSYYAALLQGEATDRALHIAQREALDGTATKHPFYWAGMTVYGVVEGVGF